jgi:hypothetical protein
MVTTTLERVRLRYSCYRFAPSPATAHLFLTSLDAFLRAEVLPPTVHAFNRYTLTRNRARLDDAVRAYIGIPYSEVERIRVTQNL